MLNLLSNISFEYPLYFLYGASFFLLSFAIFIKDRKTSDLRLANSLWLLGMFGFIHGAREWFQIFPIAGGEHLSLREIYLILLIAACLGALSFSFLLQFGLSLLRDIDNRRWRWITFVPAALLLLWVVYLGHQGFETNMKFLRDADSLARILLGFTGALLTGYGLITYSREIHPLSRSGSEKLRNAGIVFLFYGVLAGVMPSHSMVPYFPFPVEVLRGLSAILVTFFIIKALNIFNVEARQKIEQQMKHVIQAEKLSSLGQLAAGIAHEINNPLTNASLGIQTLKAWSKGIGTDPKVLDKLGVVEKNIDRAAIIARELLQFSRQSDVEAVPFNVATALNGALTLMQYKLKNCAVHLDLSPVPDVTGDPGRIEQVFINLLSNAVEAMPQGGEISIVSMTRKENIEVRITDTGSGIPSEHLSRVFDPFFTTKEIGAGTGLGLSICYGIIRQHHGTLKITSTPGKGTTVSIHLPVGGTE